MRGVLRKWTPRDKYFKYQNFPTHFCLSLFQKCFNEIWWKSDKSIYPVKFAWSCCILAHKGSQTTRATPGDYLAPWSRNQWDNEITGPPAVNDDGSRFPGNSNPLQTCFFFYLDCSVERWGGRHNNEQSCERQRKKPATKMEKPTNVLREKIMNRQRAFKISIKGER